MLNVYCWCPINYLQINPTKTTYMIPSLPQNSTSRAFLTVNNHVKSLFATTKYFSVILDKNFKFHYHVQSMLKKWLSELMSLSKHAAILNRSLFFHYTLHIFIVIFRTAFHYRATHKLTISNLFKPFKTRPPNN